MNIMFWPYFDQSFTVENPYQHSASSCNQSGCRRISVALAEEVDDELFSVKVRLHNRDAAGHGAGRDRRLRCGTGRNCNCGKHLILIGKARAGVSLSESSRCWRFEPIPPACEAGSRTLYQGG